MMKYARWILLVLLLICPAALVFDYVREFLAVDAALDSGASWDYLAHRPDFAQNHPFIPYSARHGTLIAAACVSLLIVPIYLGLLYVTKQQPNVA
jgi:hypothetical protein